MTSNVSHRLLDLSPTRLRAIALIVVSPLIVAVAAVADASISNRVSLKNERLERHEYIQRCTAFFILIAEFRDRRPGEGDRLKATADVMAERSTEIVGDPAATDEAVADYLAQYRETLRAQFGPVQSATFRTYDLLLMQEDLKFCKDLTKAEGLAPRRPLPAR
ncbi:MAG: hypothetical protein AAGC81_03715 [Pseudomonadota bacterium]